MATGGEAALRGEGAARQPIGAAVGPGRGGDPQLRPLLEAAGRDVSRWFDPQTGDPLSRVDPRSGLLRFLPPGAPPPEPRSDWAPPAGRPAWAVPRPGGGGAAPRPLRLCNTLTGQEHVIQVPGGPAGGLVRWALPWNSRAGGYAWRWGGAPLRPEQPPPPPLPDGSAPTLLLCFADDFAEERPRPGDPPAGRR